LASTAAFLFLTGDSSLSAGAFLKKNSITVFLVFLAYLIRSEMLLLLLPFICVAGVIDWGNQEKIFTKENFVKYLTIIGSILMSLVIGQASHMLAYGSSDWRTFTEYFDNRTELYDFQVLPEYEENEGFYESIGLIQSEWKLLDNYNFGLDEEIDEKLLLEIADYAAQNRSAESSFAERLRAALGNYYRRTFYGPEHNESDAPLSWILLLSYFLVLIMALLEKGKRFSLRLLGILWKLAFLGSVRTVLWLWLIMRERVPVRISHSMYLMEFCILLGMLFMQCRELWQEQRKRAVLFAGTLYCLAGLAVLPETIALTDADVAAKAENNIRYQQLYSYLREEGQKDNFYFIDVYSSVLYTEKMFKDVDNTLANYDIMGGWACKSPLWRKKLSAFGIENMEQALVSREDVYYVQESGADTEWLVKYYEDRGMEVQCRLVDTVGDAFEVYEIRSVQENDIDG
jgi:hypothetical protein